MELRLSWGGALGATFSLEGRRKGKFLAGASELR